MSCFGACVGVQFTGRLHTDFVTSADKDTKTLGMTTYSAAGPRIVHLNPVPPTLPREHRSNVLAALWAEKGNASSLMCFQDVLATAVDSFVSAVICMLF